VGLFILRVLAVGILIGLYELHPLVGVAALASGIAYVVGRGTRHASQ